MSRFCVRCFLTRSTHNSNTCATTIETKQHTPARTFIGSFAISSCFHTSFLSQTYHHSFSRPTHSTAQRFNLLQHKHNSYEQFTVKQNPKIYCENSSSVALIVCSGQFFGPIEWLFRIFRQLFDCFATNIVDQTILLCGKITFLLWKHRLTGHTVHIFTIFWYDDIRPSTQLKRTRKKKRKKQS